MTEAATTERNIVSEELFIGARIFDYRRFGTLVYRYRKSKLWTIPVIRKVNPKSTPLNLIMQLAEHMPVQGDRRVTTARTILEISSDRAMQNSETDFIRWNMVIYHLEYKGDAIATLNPFLQENADEIRFVPGRDILAYFKEDGVNEITYRFAKALEKQECLR